MLYELISLYDVSYGVFLSLRSFVFISCWLSSCGRLLYYVYVFYRKSNSSMGSTNCMSYRFLIHAKKLAYGLHFQIYIHLEIFNRNLLPFCKLLIEEQRKLVKSSVVKRINNMNI